MLQKIKPKKFKLGIIGGGPGSWIGHVHRISSRYDDKYEIVAGVFSRSVDKSRKFGQSIGSVSYTHLTLPTRDDV